MQACMFSDCTKKAIRCVGVCRRHIKRLSPNHRQRIGRALDRFLNGEITLDERLAITQAVVEEHESGLFYGTSRGGPIAW